MKPQKGIAHIALIIVGAVLVAVYFLQPERRISDSVWQERIDAAFSPSECPQVTKPNFQVPMYEGKLIDSHFHISHLPDYGPGEDWNHKNDKQPYLGTKIKVADWVCMMEREGTEKVFAFFPVFESIEAPSLEVVKRTMELYPDKFVPFIMPPDNDNDPDGFPTVDAKTLTRMLDTYPGLFKGYGEIGMYARDGGAKAMFPDHPRLLEIYPILRKEKLLVYMHLGENQKESFEKVLSANPNINFIWHGGQLTQFDEERGKRIFTDLDDILSRHPNAYYTVDELYGGEWLLHPDVSKEKFLAYFKDYEKLLEKDVDTWKAFIERHPNQVMFGTDRGWSADWTVDPEVGVTLTDYSRAFIAKLDPGVQEKFAYQNAEDLLRAKIQ